MKNERNEPNFESAFEKNNRYNVQCTRIFSPIRYWARTSNTPLNKNYSCSFTLDYSLFI